MNPEAQAWAQFAAAGMARGQTTHQASLEADLMLQLYHQRFAEFHNQDVRNHQTLADALISACHHTLHRGRG